MIVNESKQSTTIVTRNVYYLLNICDSYTLLILFYRIARLAWKYFVVCSQWSIADHNIYDCIIESLPCLTGVVGWYGSKVHNRKSRKSALLLQLVLMIKNDKHDWHNCNVASWYRMQGTVLEDVWALLLFFDRLVSQTRRLWNPGALAIVLPSMLT